MPPRKRARGGASQSVSTPNTTRSDDAMDVDTPKSETPTKATTSKTPTIDIYNDMWTDDQLSSLFKGVIRWKPAGMHKHFRMIAISEHLRNHGFDPDIHQHTRIPRIWERLRAHYNLDVIDERENFDDEAEDKYLEFSLGRQFHELIEERVLRGSDSEMSSAESAEEVEEETEEQESEKEEEKKEKEPVKGSRRGKRNSERLRSGRSSTVDDSEDVTEAESPAPKVARTARGRGRGRGRGGRGGRASMSKQVSEAEESSDEEEEEEEEEESGSDEEEESAEEAATP
ncbi:hypothetical protein jhhlp_003538 [Lomentospora prolificans]|uniref:CT20 family protein n=1 Tax=Lomentospora prolificans TaxID=41688 RepID=A0A2N3N916_9PEZI|nr:hypothetical protein jhhlp_003538 [Lomentospora prolificans]